MIPDITLVVGVDAYHFEELKIVWPTWVRHKPGILKMPMIVFFDDSQVTPDGIRACINHPNLKVVRHRYAYKNQDAVTKWNDPQRTMMFSGFVSVPSMYVKTPYWMKLDTDCVATGQPDWILPEWFSHNPAIIAQAWSFTKPPDQMLVLDEWSETRDFLKIWKKPKLELRPEPGASRLGHKRIISWCGIFETDFTKDCFTLSPIKLPVGSQDGFMWYCAQRLDREVRRVDMKSRGWEHWGTRANLIAAAKRACDA